MAVRNDGRNTSRPPLNERDWQSGAAVTAAMGVLSSSSMCRRASKFESTSMSRSTYTTNGKRTGSSAQSQYLLALAPKPPFSINRRRLRQRSQVVTGPSAGDTIGPRHATSGAASARATREESRRTFPTPSRAESAAWLAFDSDFSLRSSTTTTNRH